MTLLTIAIPTYNRLEYLKELLPELLKQCASHPEIELLISDNCSTDGSWEYLRNIAEHNRYVRVVKNLSNVGGDENFVRCVETARSEYVWLFGDDEQICKDALDLVIDTLTLYSAVSLFIVGETFNENPFFMGTFSTYLKTSKTLDLVNHTLITCNIFKKRLFDCDIARKYSKSRYGHMHAIMDALKIQGDIYCINGPIISVRSQRAPFKEKLVFMRIKQIQYLRYLGIPSSQILSYICTGILWPSAVRQIRKVKGAMI